MFKKLPKYIQLLIQVYLLELLFLFFYRVLFLLLFKDKMGDSVHNMELIKAFGIGFQFDSVIICYLLLIPFLINSIIYLLNLNERLLIKFNKVILNLSAIGIFAASCADLAYFRQFFTRLNSAIFAWNDSPMFAIKIFVQDIYLVSTLLPISLSIFCFWIATNKIFDYHYGFNTSFQKAKPIWQRFLTVFITLIIIAIGTRGRLSSKSPIRIGTAYFTNDSFINQLGLNPTFTLLKSLQIDQRNSDKRVSYMDDKIAIKNVQNYLDIQMPYDPKFPISRLQTPVNLPSDKNVILIIMEGMSGAKSRGHGGSFDLTPYLDSLKEKSLSFNSIYTAGIHTYNGIYSSLYSLPAIMNIHPMKTTKIEGFSGIANTLKDNNYESIYFTTHDGQFDNVSGFLSANGFDQIISQKDYPRDKILSSLGVADHYMFEFALPYIKKITKKSKPFFAAFMTASDHGPWIVPEDITFKPSSDVDNHRTVQYADWAISHLINISSKEPWFKDTVFVFIADHGASWDTTYDMPLSYHHTPFIIYDPSSESGNIIQSLGLQIDLFPTLMSYLGIEFVNNTMGIDLLSLGRPFAYFAADNKYGVLNYEYYFVKRDNKVHSLYNYPDKDPVNYLKSKESLVKQMKLYSESFIQATQALIKANQVDHIKKGTP